MATQKTMDDVCGMVEKLLAQARKEGRDEGVADATRLAVTYFGSDDIADFIKWRIRVEDGLL